MKATTVAYYARIADAREYGYQTYGGDAGIAALRCFKAYHPQGRFTPYGDRWLTPIQMRILSVLQRHALSPGVGLLQVREVALEAKASPGYVSKTILRLNAWGMIATISVRGRFGGMYVALRVMGDTLGHYATEARARLSLSSLRAAARRVRRGINVSTITRRGRVGDQGLPDYRSSLVGMEETFRTPFARRALVARATLALTDPEGEGDAVHPLTEDLAIAIIEHFQDDPDNSDLIEALDIPAGNGKGRIVCPAHGEGRSKTLSWKVDGDRLLLHCFAGCTFEEIRKAALG